MWKRDRKRRGKNMGKGGWQKGKVDVNELGRRVERKGCVWGVGGRKERRWELGKG